jgi:hypothetical protein
MKPLLVALIVVFSLLLTSCDTHQMGYAEKDSDFNFLTTEDTCYSYWFEVDEDGYADSITFRISADWDSVPARPLSYRMEVFSCDSSGENLTALRTSSMLYDPWGPHIYEDNDSGFLDLSSYNDSTMFFDDLDSTWNYATEITFIFGFNDTIEPPYLSVRFTSTMNVQGKRIQKSTSYFLIRKSITIPHSGSWSHPGKLFCGDYEIHENQTSEIYEFKYESASL